MEHSEALVLFISHYITLMKKFKMSVYAEGRASVLDNIKSDLLHKIFFIYCHVGFEPAIECTIQKIQTTALAQFHNASAGDGDYKISSFSTAVYGKEMNKAEIFALQLLLIMQLEMPYPRYPKWYSYLIEIPISILQTEYENSDRAKNTRVKEINIEEGMSCLEEMIEKYRDILYPVEFEEYRMDLVWIKIIYENFFYRCRYNVKQGRINLIERRL